MGGRGGQGGYGGDEEEEDEGEGVYPIDVSGCGGGGSD